MRYYASDETVDLFQDHSLTDKERVLSRYPDAKSKKETKRVKKTYVSPYPYLEKDGYRIKAGPFEVWDENPRNGWSRIVYLINNADDEQKRQKKVKEMLSDFNAFDAKWYFSDISIFKVSEHQKTELKGMIFDYLQKHLEI